MSKSDLPAAAAEMVLFFEEAVSVHVYNREEGELPPADCEMMASIERVRAALGLPPSAIVRDVMQDAATPALPLAGEPDSIRTTLPGGLEVTSVFQNDGAFALPSAGDLPPRGIAPAGKLAVMHRPSPQAMQARCDAFNRVCPIGGAVKVRLDDRTMIDTVTVTKAQVLSGHTPVVWLRDIVGCYDLDRVTPQDVI